MDDGIVVDIFISGQKTTVSLKQAKQLRDALCKQFGLPEMNDEQKQKVLNKLEIELQKFKLSQGENLN